MSSFGGSTSPVILLELRRLLRCMPPRFCHLRVAPAKQSTVPASSLVSIFWLLQALQGGVFGPHRISWGVPTTPDPDISANGGVYTTVRQQENLLVNYHDRYGRCIAVLFQSARGRFDDQHRKKRERQRERTSLGWHIPKYLSLITDINNLLGSCLSLLLTIDLCH